MARKPDLERRREILAQAFEVLRERGVHQTTMSDLAAALGMKRPTLYWYMRDLGDLFDYAFDEIQTRFLAVASAQLAGLEHPLDAIDAVLDAGRAFNAQHRDLIILLFQLWAVGRSKDPQAFLAHNRRYVQPFREGLAALLVGGVAAGQVAACDVAAVVDLILVVGDGMLVQQITREVDGRGALAALRTHVLGPLRAASEGEPTA